MIWDIILCGILYTILIVFVFIRTNRKRPNNDTDSDDEGGLPVSLPPDIDLPPGICLPDDAPRNTITEPEEVFA
ncbi:MAG: hypothetical protein CMB80_06535 [Flammeovirgaceae bacterium]|nr:hypothetical protein [Flammeovirgaceae bacterium]MBE62242.1 hypothetical protein [Flammeovirgaceae bacterium]MBE63811.1 hypothetical protein [Flammeovirgaceae bacterium]MBR09546.1 hypothetical protein [Rickettsiales bacterium]HCX24934.1 hypothetical protein [Cytophagales bacterium]|tara:strand:- start:10689 stop:10910 length:222 start_codon:yes stop_codon:yes gene_type:complete